MFVLLLWWQQGSKNRALAGALSMYIPLVVQLSRGPPLYFLSCLSFLALFKCSTFGTVSSKCHMLVLFLTGCKNCIILHCSIPKFYQGNQEGDTSRGGSNSTLPCKATMMNREGKEGNAKPCLDSSQSCRSVEAPTASHHVFFIRPKQPGIMAWERWMEHRRMHACMHPCPGRPALDSATLLDSNARTGGRLDILANRSELCQKELRSAANPNAS